MQPRTEHILVVDELAQELNLVRVTPYIRSDSLSGTSWIEGLAEIRTQDGQRVNALKDGTFQLVSTGATLAPHSRKLA